MERPTLEGETRNLQALIRRMKAALPEIKTVAGFGCSPEAFSQAASREGVVSVEAGADAEIHVCADESFQGSSLARVISVVACAATCPYHMLSHRPARRYVTLKDWVAGWFPRNPLLAKLLVSPAVQDRFSSNRWPGHFEWVFVRDQPETRPGREWADRVKYHLVTMGGSGAFPIMPATVASLLVLPFGLALYAWVGMSASAWIWLVVCLAATLGCLFLEKWAARWFLAEDPKEFVLDELAGLALAWALLPPSASWNALIWAFLLFRVFDIFKWGVDWVEKVPFRGRVVWDDLLAGLYAGVIVWLAIFIA